MTAAHLLTMPQNVYPSEPPSHEHFLYAEHFGLNTTQPFASIRPRIWCTEHIIWPQLLIFKMLHFVIQF